MEASSSIVVTFAALLVVASCTSVLGSVDAVRTGVAQVLPTGRVVSQQGGLAVVDNALAQSNGTEGIWGFSNRSDVRAVYARDGFVRVPGFYSPEEVAQLHQYVEEVSSEPEVAGGQMMYFEQGLRGEGRILRRAEDFAHRHAGINAMFMAPDSRLVEFTEHLIGEPVVLFKEKINFKFPGASGFKAHQDHQAGWEAYVNWFLSIGVCVDEATPHNGGLEVAAGYHTQGLLGQEWKPIEDLDLPYEPVPCEPGDLIVFDSFVPHRSFPNLSDDTRRLIFLTYNKAAEGDHRTQYFADKRLSYPPDIERNPDKDYHYRV